ncbi:MAG: polyphosphate polymerase domain-containing protein [Bacteroidota bacterium]
MARLEYKYYIPYIHLDQLRRDIIPYLKYDAFALKTPRKEYTVKSVYLDSPGFITYHEKDMGIRARHKYRIRGYNEESDDSIVFLEIKRKDVDFISKDRAKLLYRNLDQFIETKDYSLLAGSNGTADYARNFLYYYHLYQLKPVVVVTYEREAFECGFGTDLRITFDKNIRTRPAQSCSDIFSDEQMKISLKDYFVLEVKFSTIVPSWVPRVLNKYNVFRDSASKYLMCVNTTFNSN